MADTISQFQTTNGLSASTGYFSSGVTFASNISAPNVVYSFNGSTGAVTFSNYVTSVNGSTGAITNIAVTGANTFAGLQTMNAGLTANNLWVTNGATFAARSAFNAGITASTLYVSGGVTFAGTVSSDTGYRISSSAVNAQTGTTYSLTASDNGKIVTMNNGATSTVTIIAGLPVGFNATVIQLGAGAVGFSAASGVTLNSFASSVYMAGQHGAATVIAYATNIFNLSGTLTP
jgi:hypothetical protein